MNKKASVMVGFFLTVSVVIIVVYLYKMGEYTIPVFQVSASVREKNALAIEAARTKAERMKYIDLEWEFAESARKHEAKIKNIPQDIIFGNAVRWAILTSCVAAFLIVVTISGLTGKQLATANPEALALMFMTAFPKSKEHWNFLKESKRVEGQRIKQLGLIPQEQEQIIYADNNPVDIALPVVQTTAAQCLEMKLIDDNPDKFLWGFDESEEPVFLKLSDKGFKVAIIGETHQGKTFEALSLAAQARMKGYHGIFIDLHAHADRSFYKYMGSLADSPAITWCTSPDDVVLTLKDIIEVIVDRLQNGYKNRVLIVIDDALGIAGDDEYKDIFNSAMGKAVTEGPKVGISTLLLSHNWQADTVSKKVRSNLSDRIAYKSDTAESRLLFQNKKAALLTPALSQGQAILLDSSKDIHQIHAPYWSAGTVDKIADMIGREPAPQEPVKWGVRGVVGKRA